MYLTIPETADYLGMPVSQVTKYVLEGRIRAVDDGEQFMINKEQFNNFHDHLEIAKQQIEEWQKNFLLPDRDIRDED
ncbi:excisionase family DNA-binding protein [Sporosarcina ureilytica]|uniref:DNA-binding protein n=1 Tax=Sporosarcina ureilytica TaxID=298596 RepID=A0A1D8JBY6_9BACL|nr:excisionase family DNA-binding protein [Sporosarcina ureilytica]AOV06211.1 DNA-binding protein [Sporosarcina ureilytica]